MRSVSGIIRFKIITIILLVIVVWDTPGYSVDEGYAASDITLSYLAHPSLFDRTKPIIQTHQYCLVKINATRYLYIAYAVGDSIELVKTKEGWHAEHQGRVCAVQIQGAETQAHGDIVVCLLKKDYHIQRIYHGVIYLQPYTHEPFLFRVEDIDVPGLKARLQETDNSVTKLILSQLGVTRDTVASVSEEQIIAVLNRILKMPMFYKETYGSISFSKREGDINRRIYQLWEIATNRASDRRTLTLQELAELNKKLLIIMYPKQLNTHVVSSPLLAGETIIHALQKVLAESKGSSIPEVADMEEAIRHILELLARDKETYEKRHYDNELLIESIQVDMGICIYRLCNFLSSSQLEVQVVGEHLKNTLYTFAAQSDEVHTIAISMLFTLDESQLLLQKCFIEQIVIPTLRKETHSDEEFAYSVSEVSREDEAKNIWTVMSGHTRLTTCCFDRKHTGFQFGAVAVVQYEFAGAVHAKKYFVKSHRLYTAYNSEWRDGCFRILSTIYPRKPSVKEMVVYTMVAKLGIGPTIHFITNPYVRSGLFIVSEDVASEADAHVFEEAGMLEESFFFGIHDVNIEKFKIALQQKRKIDVVVCHTLGIHPEDVTSLTAERLVHALNEMVKMPSLFHEAPPTPQLPPDVAALLPEARLAYDRAAHIVGRPPIPFNITWICSSYVGNGILKTPSQKHQEFMAMLEKEMKTPEPSPLKTAITQIDLLSRIFNFTDFHSGNFGCVGRETSTPEWKLLDFIIDDREVGMWVEGFFQGSLSFRAPENGILRTVLHGRPRTEKIQMGTYMIHTFKELRFHQHLDETIHEIEAYLRHIVPEYGVSVAELWGMDMQEVIQNLKDYQRYVERNFEIFEQALATEEARNLVDTLTKERGIRLRIVESIDSPHSVDIEVLAALRPERPRVVAITTHVVQILGRMLSIFGKDCVRELLCIMIDKGLAKEALLFLVRCMHQLDTLHDVPEQSKAKAAVGMLELLRMDTICSLFVRAQGDDMEIHLPLFKNVMTAI